MQWVQGGEAFRLFTAPLPKGKQRSPYDTNPHATNVWGHAQKLLTAEFRVIAKKAKSAGMKKGGKKQESAARKATAILHLKPRGRR
jgi:hypothetical protein